MDFSSDGEEEKPFSRRKPKGRRLIVESSSDEEEFIPVKIPEKVDKCPVATESTNRRAKLQKSHPSIFDDDDSLFDSDSSFEDLFQNLKIAKDKSQEHGKPNSSMNIKKAMIGNQNHLSTSVSNVQKNYNQKTLFPNRKADRKILGRKDLDLSLEDGDSWDSENEASEGSRGSSDSESEASEGSLGSFEEGESDNNSDGNASRELDQTKSAWSLHRKRNEYYLKNSSGSNHFPRVLLPATLFNRLYDYQAIGVQFMASLHKECIGGVLGDDMGMGKTFMTLSFIGGLMRAGTIRNALVLAPLSVLRSWKKEAENVLSKCVSRVRIQILSSEISRSKRTRLLKDALNCSSEFPYFIISTYGMVRESTMDFVNSDKSYWDYVVLDEGHTIKNKNSAVSKSCHRICQNRKTHRLMLTGTPLMNNLGELWTLFDWATSGKVLGTHLSFKNYFAKPIEAARNKNASPATIQGGERVNRELQEMLKPHFLQRLKVDFLMDKLPPKEEMVVWTHISAEQRSIYTTYVSSGDSVVRSILTGEKSSALEAITVLKKLCGHPLLVERQVDIQKVMKNYDVQKLLGSSTKLQILISLLQDFSKNGHRTLIFSQSTRMLDIIERVIKETCDFRVGRIDGSTRERDRQAFVDSFNGEKSNIAAMLLSTKAAGVGITLTGADRVIVYDPSWTPGEDSQAVDRCYRIGQKRPVLVYRLIAAGTVEEKIFEKQIWKDGVRRTVFTEGISVERYFDSHELAKLFQLGEPGVCEVMEKIEDLHTDWRKFSFLLNHHGVVGLSRHDGFYHPSQVREKPASFFDGSKQTNTVGRSQRVLQDSKNLAISIPLGRAAAVFKNVESRNGTKNHHFFDLTNSTKENSINTKVQVKATKNKVKPLSGVIEILSSEDESNVSSSKIAYNNSCWDRGNQAKRENVPQLSGVNESRKEISDALIYSGTLKPKQRLKFLLEMLENVEDGIDKDQKLELHQRIARISHSLGLLS